MVDNWNVWVYVKMFKYILSYDFRIIFKIVLFKVNLNGNF